MVKTDMIRTYTEDSLKMADSLGYESIIVLANSQREDDIKSCIRRLQNSKNTMITCVGAEIEGSLNHVKKLSDKLRNSVELLSVTGEYDTIRWASSKSMVDIISPMWSTKSPGIDHIIAKQCNQNDILIEFKISDLINSSGRQRSRVIKNMSECARICKWSKCGMIVSSGAGKKWEIRDGRSLESMGRIIGIEKSSNVNDMINQNRLKVTGKAIAQGVEVI